MKIMNPHQNVMDAAWSDVCDCGRADSGGYSDAGDRPAGRTAGAALLHQPAAHAVRDRSHCAAADAGRAEHSVGPDTDGNY